MNKRPELDWEDEETSKPAESPEKTGKKAKEDSSLCKVEDPTCEACQ